MANSLTHSLSLNVCPQTAVVLRQAGKENNKHLSQKGKKYGYLVNGSNSWLIVKSEKRADEAERVFGDEVNITTEGQHHLGTVIGSQEYKDHYCREKILHGMERRN